jgi:hypothetical protein
MNIFILDVDPQTAAKYHNDKHVVKMALETAQILCTVLLKKGYTAPYRATHKNHPSILWAEKSLENFKWLKNLGIYLCKEYTHRYGKIHKCQSIIENLPYPDPNDFPQKGLTVFAQAMSDEYKNKDAVAAYRKYYIGAKSGFMNFTNRETPYWIQLEKV